MNIENIVFQTESWESTARASGNALIANGFKDAHMALKELKDERDALAKRLAEIESQKPVGEVLLATTQGAGYFFNVDWYDHCNFKAGDKLYAQPAQATYNWPSGASNLPAPQSVPDGWKLVPVEPTEHMQHAVDDTKLPDFCISSSQSRHHEIGVEVYKAMLFAAPTPECPSHESWQDEIAGD